MYFETLVLIFQNHLCISLVSLLMTKTPHAGEDYSSPQSYYCDVYVFTHLGHKIDNARETHGTMLHLRYFRVAVLS